MRSISLLNMFLTNYAYLRSNYYACAVGTVVYALTIS
jgi:hypothetical protein